MRIRGIEQILKKRGPFGLLLNLGSNFADISNAEFVFAELNLKGLQESQESLVNTLSMYYTE